MTNVTDLTATTTPVTTDLLYLVANPDTTPVDRKSTIGAVLGISPFVAKTANYTATEADEVINCDATGGAFTITLPAVATTRAGKVYTIRKLDTANSVVVDANSTETINGDLTQILFLQYSFLTIVNTGATWAIINSHGVLAGRIFNATGSVTIANDGTELTVIGTGVGNLTIPANWWRIGRSIKERVSGVISDTGTPTARFRAKLGTTVISDTTAVALAGTLSNTGWYAEVTLTCRTVGASGTIFGQVDFHYGPDNLIISGTSAAVTVDTTAAAALNLMFTWGAADPANTITASQFNASWD